MLPERKTERGGLKVWLKHPEESQHREVVLVDWSWNSSKKLTSSFFWSLFLFIMLSKHFPKLCNAVCHLRHHKQEQFFKVYSLTSLSADKLVQPQWKGIHFSPSVNILSQRVNYKVLNLVSDLSQNQEDRKEMQIHPKLLYQNHGPSVSSIK